VPAAPARFVVLSIAVAGFLAARSCLVWFFLRRLVTCRFSSFGSEGVGEPFDFLLVPFFPLAFFQVWVIFSCPSRPVPTSFFLRFGVRGELRLVPRYFVSFDGFRIERIFLCPTPLCLMRD